MVYRRKYKTPKGFKAGGRVPIADDMAIAEDAAPADADNVSISDDASDAISRALASQRHAESLQRRDPIADQIDAMPGLSDVKRALLKQHPSLVTDPLQGRAAAFYHQQALAEGIADDSVEMLQRILSGVQQEQHRAAAGSVLARAAPEAPPVEPAAAEPMPEPPRAAQARSSGQVGHLMPTAPARRSMPMSAPVSREVPGSTGRRDYQENTLSPEERDIAHRSIMDHPGDPNNLTPAQKEYIYLQNKKKLRAKIADGSYSRQGDG